MNQKIKKLSVAFVSSMILSSILTMPADGSAYERRMHGSYCSLWGSSTSISSDGIRVPAYNVAICPLPEDSSLPKRYVRRVDVHGYSSGGYQAFLCTTTHWTTGYTCPVSRGTTLGGDFAISMSPSSSWGTGGYDYDFAWIYIYFSTGGGNVRGYYMSN